MVDPTRTSTTASATTVPANEGTPYSYLYGESEFSANSDGVNGIHEDRPQQEQQQQLLEQSWSLTSSSSWGTTAAAAVAAAGRQAQQGGTPLPSPWFRRIGEAAQNQVSSSPNSAFCVSSSKCNPLHSNVEIRLSRASRIYEAGELVEGAVRIHVKDGWSHQDMNLYASGTVTLQPQTTTTSLNNQKVSKSDASTSRLCVLDQCILIKPRGRIYHGGIYQYPFSFPLVGLGGEDLLETFRGLHIQVTYQLEIAIHRTSFLSRTLETQVEFAVQVPSTTSQVLEEKTTPIEPPQVPMIPEDGTLQCEDAGTKENGHYLIFIDTLERQSPLASAADASGRTPTTQVPVTTPFPLLPLPKICIRGFLKSNIISLANPATWYEADIIMDELEEDEEGDDGVIAGHVVVEDTCGIPIRSIKARLLRVEMIQRQAGSASSVSSSGSSLSPLALFTKTGSNNDQRSAPRHAHPQRDGRGIGHAHGSIREGQMLPGNQPPATMSSPQQQQPSTHHYHPNHVAMTFSSSTAFFGNAQQPQGMAQSNSSQPPPTPSFSRPSASSSSFQTFRTEISTWQIADGDLGAGIALPLHLRLPWLSVCRTSHGFRNMLQIQFELEILVLLGEAEGGNRYRARGSLPLILQRKQKRGGGADGGQQTNTTTTSLFAFKSGP